MLAQTVRNNLKDINNLKMRRKTTKFSNLFKKSSESDSKETEFVKVLSKAGMIEIPKEEALLDKEAVDVLIELPPMQDSCENDDPYEFVENPKEVVVSFPIVSDIVCEEKLPFFKSLSFKLASL